MRSITVMCLSIGTPKIINFPFVPNGKLNISRCPKFWAHYSRIVMCFNIGTLNNHHILFGTNDKGVVLGVPKLRHFRVYILTFHGIRQKCAQQTVEGVRGRQLQIRLENSVGVHGCFM